MTVIDLNNEAYIAQRWNLLYYNGANAITYVLKYDTSVNNRFGNNSFRSFILKLSLRIKDLKELFLYSNPLSKSSACVYDFDSF